LIGKLLVFTREEVGINDCNVDFEDLEEYAKEIEKTFGCKPKLHMGQLYC
jgi:hypothetical protein